MYIRLLLPMLVGLLTFSAAAGEVWIPDDEFGGYFDSNGIYTIVGVVKNTENYAITSHVAVLVNDNGKIIPIGQDLPSVDANKDMPFKIRIPQVSTQNIILEKPTVTFSESIALPPSEIHVIYDKTLVRHDDGHITGRITNAGNHTEHNVKVYAAIHGENNKFIDTGTNVEKIEKIEPGQIVDFSIYPDPSVASDVNYYSCFNIGDETIVPLRTTRNGVDFNFRYDSTAAFTVNGFDETGTILSISGINSFKIPTYVNFEFPRSSEEEKFDVLVNGEPVKFIQSRDEEGNWHVAFDVDAATQDSIIISGFVNPNGKTTGENYGDVSPYLYVIPILAAAGVGVYFYKRKTRQ
ncbi:MAG: peptidase [Candidatus Nitrosotenuis sp.]|nr:MAG: peptidase [Candidatus Nitrosotenuis sp.]